MIVEILTSTLLNIILQSIFRLEKYLNEWSTNFTIQAKYSSNTKQLQIKRL